mmetsp:Transcript_14533/g.20718  ORF Transcript_14533/g.20718 Transcript_14533/m.20718 type:complete len:471 (+) Transcript_14533:103-1515(+)
MSVSSIGSYSVSMKKKRNAKIGVSLAKDETNGDIRVTRVAESGLAAKSNLRAGDKIMSINGKSVEGLSPEAVAAMLRASAGHIDIEAEYADDEEMPTEDDNLLSKEVNTDYAVGLSGWLGFLIFLIQVAFVVYAGVFMTIDTENSTKAEYMIFRDIMVMLLLGFGYLMTFLSKYGLSSVGITMLATVLNMECNLIFESLFLNKYALSMSSLINAEFSAATLLISFGALIGRVSPLQVTLIAVFQSLFYVINKVIVLNYLQVEDVGGTVTIHMFGAFFGLAASYALGPQLKVSASNNAATRVSDVFALIGTTLLWVYWPSFVGATETGNAVYEPRCTIHTVLALIGSTASAFYFSQKQNKGKFDPVHIQNSTLAGGVAIGATARLALSPACAVITGLIAGAVSVWGYDYSSPALESSMGIYDTCGVGNLHGFPSVVGGLLSVIFVVIYSDDSIMAHSSSQFVFQIIGIFTT